MLGGDPNKALPASEWLVSAFVTLAFPIYLTLFSDKETHPGLGVAVCSMQLGVTSKRGVAMRKEGGHVRAA